jgi:hypothetical protein
MNLLLKGVRAVPLGREKSESAQATMYTIRKKPRILWA